MKSFKKHIPHYISLFAIFFAGVLGFYLFSYDKSFQIGVAIALAGSYVSWGIIHHVIHKDIYLSVILEYVAVAILGLVMILSLILRG
ncbi:hypothetical protein A2422_02730 [Candidatus Woesebacteria bacterium RIFOXYC1_FULL_31_51]|uniref:Uncharacterized protein n=1 Tax=Candidatus Woesebacteria bacterium GW2011_GWC2_31_9 TaxID=1618586 RepID=A0A0G0AX11_9BACT|nr:MAG: hypothetical protein UR17_C0001G0050 [Candidatus Woesebacteria bacterium GW2011_GWF1_31_35]KKP23452.1 MAG: hypothetical protein UR11_C0001G0426 [Candidatus Woesebacteria bacterium GW2011_GWC1_30_29]KKP26429.1 MAG: hypothetical protein UR13_C0004G0043 [Candidatus Woesebacteria bacterium GW2011_GWD1_31_12]KKP27728.1 MAG: hypothetical protein UR16_C0002G0058 [Candidatus Woesebacteria bacterium GW2011_GWB1_31_29]KKP31135.1 MAG: hypothetical protein UR21_C0015G0009 [Candidatus Woesebacteria 